jgi:hypothetical protein
VGAGSREVGRLVRARGVAALGGTLKIQSVSAENLTTDSPYGEGSESQSWEGREEKYSVEETTSNGGASSEGGRSQSNKLCREFAKTGRCRFGQTCKFRHHKGRKKNKSKGGRAGGRSGAVTKALLAGVQQEQGKNDALNDIIREQQTEHDALLNLYRQDGRTPGESSGPRFPDDEAKLEALKARIRFQCYKFTGRTGRRQAILNRIAGYMRELELDLDKADTTDIVASLVDEELNKYNTYSSYWQRLKANYRHSKHDDFWHNAIVSPTLDFVSQHARELLYAAATSAMALCMIVRRLPVIGGFASALGCLIGGIVVAEYIYSHTGDPPENQPITDMCCDFVRVPELAPTAKYSMPAEITCVPREYPIGFTLCREALWIPRNCAHNERVAVTTRQMLKPMGSKEVRSEYWAMAAQLFIKDSGIETSLFNEVYDEVAIEEFLSRYPPRRRKPLRRELDMVLPLLDKGINTKTKGFVKREWMFKKANRQKYNPRLISGKHDEYLLSTIGYWEWFRRAKEHFSLQSKRYHYGGGRTGLELGKFVTQMEDRGWKAFETDLSRMDGHEEIECLRAEWAVYEACKCPKQLLDLIKAQANCGGRTMGGVRYSCEGKKCSGVINTSFGNTILTFMMQTMVVHDLEIVLGRKLDFHVLANGDDCVLFLQLSDGEELHLEEVMVGTHAKLGHKVELAERAADDYDTLTFCSGYFWNTGSVRVCGPKPTRALVKSFMPTDPSVDLSVHIPGVCTGYLGYDWIPLLGDFARKWANGKDLRHKHAMRAGDVEEAYVVDHETVRDQFVSIYGVGPEEVRTWLLGLPMTGSHRHPVFDDMCVRDGLLIR